MADLDAELAALEAEVENEAKAENQKNVANKSNYSNKNQNYGNNKPQPQPKKTNVNNNYNGYRNDEKGLEDFLNSDDTTNQNNNNYNNYNYQSKTNNNYSNYSNNNNNYSNYSNHHNQYNNYNNYNNNNNNYYNPQKNNQQNNYQNKNQNQYNNMSSHTQVKQKPQNQYNNMNPHAQVKQKPQNQNQYQNQPKIDPKNSSKTQVISKAKQQQSEPKEDIYPIKQENMYHKLKEMKSITVLEEEIALCDKIIAFKKKRGLEYDDWESKKDLAQLQLNNTKSLIESGNINFDAYKKLIMGELAYEKKILQFTENDKMSKPYELAEIKRRIEQRIKVINDELTQNIDEEEGDEEPKQPEQKSTINNPNKEPVNNQKSNSKISNNTGNKTAVNPKMSQPQNIPQDSDPREKASTQIVSNNKKNNINPQSHHHLNQIPKQYIIQKKVLVTDPKTGKQMYVMKNVVDPKYEQALKQKALQTNQNKPAPDNKNQQHIIQQKVLVTDPKTGKQMYVMKNVVDPKYANQINNENKLKQAQDQMKAQTSIIRPKANINEEIKKYQLYINTLIKEYTEAKEYFKRNGQEQLANKSRQDLRILLAAKQKVDMGRYKEVKLNLLPKTITPEYIFGYTEAERTNKFKIVLTQLIKDKKEIDDKMNSIMEKMKKLRKKDLEKAKEAVKPKLDEMKQKRDNIVKVMESLKEKFRDKWTPAPEYGKVMEEEKIEKVSYEGAVFGLKIKVGKTDYDKDKTFLKLRLEANKNKIMTKEVHLKQMGDYNEEWRWDFNGDEFKNIAKGFLYIELFRQHTFSDDKKGEGKIDLGNIRRGTPFKSECKIEIESKRVVPTIMFLITPIMPEGKKYYESVQKEKIKITKIYPAFTGKQQVELPSDKPQQIQNQQPQNEVAPKNQNLNQQKVNNNKPNPTANTNTNQAQNMPKLDKSKFKPEELEDVDFIDNLNTLKVLEFKIKELEDKMKKIDGRTPREMLTKKVKMNVKKKQLEEGMGDGSITPKDYMELMKVQLEHDQLLGIYFKQNNEEQKLKVVMGRIALIKQEIEELKPLVK